jgi:phosphoglycolate phosphatase-like HAD superfamily hydrolase
MSANATFGLHNRIALVFDLDDTLAPDTYGTVVESCGIDPEEFAERRVRPLLDDGWSEVLAKAFCLIEESDRRGGAITAGHLAEVARNVRFFDGVPEMFDHVERSARDLLPDVEVEFYILSAGLYDVAKHLRIADRFRRIWGCEFYFDREDRIRFMKQIVTHPEKVRYLHALSRGTDISDPDAAPSRVFEPVPDDELHVPLDQVIYVGDGASDIPAFRLMNQAHGIALGVVKQASTDDWPARRDMDDGTRLQNLAPADFSEGSEMLTSLSLAVEQICKRIALRKLSVGD